MGRCRIGVVGTLSSHTGEFCRTVAGRRDALVTAVLPDDGEPIPGLPTRPNLRSLLGDVDAVAVFSRDPRAHAAVVEAAIEAGRRTFVDKPLTVDSAEAEHLVDRARRAGVALTSFSALRFAPERSRWGTEVARAREAGDLVGVGARGPVDLQSPWCGAWFYAPHVLELLGEWWPVSPDALTVSGRDGVRSARWARDGVDVTGVWDSEGEGFALWWEDASGGRHEVAVPVGAGYYDPASERILAFAAGVDDGVPAGECAHGIALAERVLEGWQESRALDR